MLLARRRPQLTTIDATGDHLDSLPMLMFRSRALNSYVPAASGVKLAYVAVLPSCQLAQMVVFGRRICTSST